MQARSIYQAPEEGRSTGWSHGVAALLTVLLLVALGSALGLLVGNLLASGVEHVPGMVRPTG